MKIHKKLYEKNKGGAVTLCLLCLYRLYALRIALYAVLQLDSGDYTTKAANGQNSVIPAPPQTQ